MTKRIAKTTVKNPVRTNDVRWREHGASSMEKAILAIHPRSGERGIWLFPGIYGSSVLNEYW